MKLIQASDAYELLVIATGMHLSPSFGETYREIERDGFRINSRIEMLLAGDTATSISKSVGLGVSSFADAFEFLKPDLVVVLGDRFEIFAAVQAALFSQIPVAHLCGGDVTEGAFDDAIRHAISKMSHIHFPSNKEAVGRLQKMGESASNIHCVGSTGLDRLRDTTYMSKENFCDVIGLTPCEQILLIAFHPETLEKRGSAEQVHELLSALENINAEIGLLFTGANADTGGLGLNASIQRFVQQRGRSVFHMSLGSDVFLNALNNVDAIVGNSSSGLYEAPSFGIPTVNIGDRQKGRLRADSVIDCELERAAITKSVLRALAMEKKPVINPYGDGRSAERILHELSKYSDFRSLIKKSFN